MKHMPKPVPSAFQTRTNCRLNPYQLPSKLPCAYTQTTVRLYPNNLLPIRKQPCAYTQNKTHIPKVTLFGGHVRGMLGARFLVHHAPAKYLVNSWINQKGARGHLFFTFNEREGGWELGINSIIFGNSLISLFLFPNIPNFSPTFFHLLQTFSYLCTKYRPIVVNDACWKASISECRVPV